MYWPSAVWSSSFASWAMAENTTVDLCCHHNNYLDFVLLVWCCSVLGSVSLVKGNVLSLILLVDSSSCTSNAAVSLDNWRKVVAGMTAQTAW